MIETREVAMDNTKNRRLSAKRTRVLADAMIHSRNAMLLLQGVEVAFGTERAYLDFAREISMLTCALGELGLDVSLPVRCHGHTARLEVAMN